MEEAALVAAHSPKVKQTFTKILILYFSKVCRGFGKVDRVFSGLIPVFNLFPLQDTFLRMQYKSCISISK